MQAEWLIENVDDTEPVNMCYQKGSDGYDHTTQRNNGLFETLDAAGFNYDLKATLISEYMRDIAMTEYSTISSLVLVRSIRPNVNFAPSSNG